MHPLDTNYGLILGTVRLEWNYLALARMFMKT